MKKIYFSVISVFIVQITFSQVNDYFLNNPQWQVKFQAFSGSDCSGYLDTYNYNEMGDTIINLLTYKKIHRKGIYSPVDVMCNPYSPSAYINTSPSFYLRSFGKQMYIIQPGSITEELLYDFNLNVGDTLPASYTVPAGSNITVTAIDSIFTPYGYRKRFQLSSASQYLYEGIGSSAGLVEEIYQVFLSGTRDLLCFSLNDISYVPTTGSSCNMIVGIDDIENKEIISVFPNPATDMLSVYLHNIKEEEIKVYNIIGKLMMAKMVTEGSQIDVSTLPKGMYFISLKRKTKVCVKFIKQ